MSEVPAINQVIRPEQANQASEENEEKGVPMSRSAHVGTGLFLTVFGGIFGGGPLTILIGLVLNSEEAFEPLVVGLFLTPFILIGGAMFIFGMVTLVSGLIGYPLITSYDEEDEEGMEGEATSMAFTYASEDDVVDKIRDAEAQRSIAEGGKKAPTLGWGMAPVDLSEPSDQPPASDEAEPSAGGEGAFWGGMTGDDMK